MIQAEVPGTCSPNSAGNVIFSALGQNQRAGLTYSRGILYVTWASHCDNNPYTGWVMAFSGATGALQAVFNSAPDTGTPS